MKIDENSEYDTKYTYANTDNKNANISDKITIHVDKNEKQMHRRDSDNENKLTTLLPSDADLNHFTASMNMWQNYAKVLTNIYRQLLFKNQSMSNGELWFMYWRFDSQSKEQEKSS
jgi:hypothetical protein